MTDSTRVRLVVPDEPTEVPGDFAEILNLEAEYAELLLTLAPRNLNSATLSEWPEYIDASARKTYGDNNPVFNAVTGVYFAVIGDGLWDSIELRHQRSYIGSLGQSRLIAALTEISQTDRKALTQHANEHVHTGVLGAMAVTRLAAALGRHGAVCALPDVIEDVDYKIDLLCAYGNIGACIQVKCGAPKASRITIPRDKDEDRFLAGVRKFNELYGLAWTPIWTSIRPECSSPKSVLHTRGALAVAKDVILAMQAP